MKLNNKALIAISITGMVFLVLSTIDIIRLPLTYFISMTLILFISLFFLLRIFILNRIIQLYQLIEKIYQENHLPLLSSKNDEITLLNIYIEKIVEKFRQINDELKENNQRLQKKIEQFQQEKIAYEKKSYDQKEYLTQMSHYDNLTTLPNRVFFNEILNKSINYAKRRQKVLAILLIELDTPHYTEEINDRIIKEMGSRFAKVLRSEDVLARTGSDEFIVLLNDINKPKFASIVAQKILKESTVPIQIDHQKFTVSANIGIAIYPNDGLSLEELLKNADAALYKAKHIGYNTYQYHAEEIGIEAHAYHQIETALRQAIHNEELSLYYQPKLDIKRGIITSVEALIRWNHPEFGIIHPKQFISIAEENGFIVQIGEWALREACRVNKHWQEEGYEHMIISVNLSAIQFRHPDIANTISRILKETALSPKYLELEINETTIMDDIEFTTNQLTNLKATGVQISIDHFGTGYTSISHLKQFSVTTLKIDQSFIKGIPQNPDDMAITNALISLAHNLGINVVAEGVETPEQVEYLAAQHCDLVQGYFLSYPIPANKIIAQFKKLNEKALI